MGEVINYKKTSQKIFSVTDIEYVAGKTEGMLDAFPSILSVNMCTPPAKDGRPPPLAVPQGQTKMNIVSDPIVINQDGYFIHGTG
jgi:hypothetical protein